MKEFKLQFKPEDISDKLKEIHLYDEEKKKDFNIFEGHAIISPLAAFFIEVESLSMMDWRDSTFIENPVVRGYIQNLYHLAEIIKKNSYDMRDEIHGDKLDEKSIEEKAKDYHWALNQLVSFLPVSENLESLISLNAEQKRMLLRIDTDGKFLVYNANRVFSPNFIRETYILDGESFFMEMREILSYNNIRLGFDDIQPIEIKFDYITNVFSPIVQNISNHAFNPENDIFNRMGKEKFIKYAAIRGYPENKDLQQGLYIFKVMDHGFGINGDIFPHIFEEGFTTKKDKKIKHGLGLHGVKKYVEERDGTIEVKTELGKRTTFIFTIPYSNKRDIYFVQ